MKVKEEELLEEISGYLHGYLKSGKLQINSFLSKINVNISNLEQLLILRFLLKTETKAFVRELPVLLKRFKTTTMMKNDTHIGEVRGQIDWAQTTKERLSRNHRDRTIFSTNESIRSYNTPENLVLKELLGLFYRLLYKDSYIKGFEKATWFSEWQGIKINVLHAHKKNIYLQRVDEVHVSERLVQKTMRHRNKLYRQAAKLLLTYRRLVRGQYGEEDIRILLRETFIAPDNIDVLVELYWIVQLLRQNTDESQLYLMDGRGRESIISSWDEGAYVYRLYHDSSGSGAVKFRISGSEIERSDNLYLQQRYLSFKKSNEIAAAVFSRKKSEDIWRGRPDFLLEIADRETNKIIKVVIGEVKNTSNMNYAITGLEELLDYLYFVKDSKGAYLQDSDVLMEGMLCVGDVDVVDDARVEGLKVLRIGKEANLKLVL